jgi:hypothetical protein
MENHIKMKTIEERACEYAAKNTSRYGKKEGIDTMLEDAYIAGADFEREYRAIQGSCGDEG